MSRGTPQHTVRIEDALWEDAKEAAAEHGMNVSDVIRATLTLLVRRPEETTWFLADARST